MHFEAQTGSHLYVSDAIMAEIQFLQAGAGVQAVHAGKPIALQRQPLQRDQAASRIIASILRASLLTDTFFCKGRVVAYSKSRTC